MPDAQFYIISITRTTYTHKIIYPTQGLRFNLLCSLAITSHHNSVRTVYCDYRGHNLFAFDQRNRHTFENKNNKVERWCYRSQMRIAACGIAEL